MPLIVEDDVDFALILLDMARERGFRGIVASRADQALTLARRYKPVAVTLDVHLPDRSGWTVLDSLKYDPATRHIPVHVISVEDDRARGLRRGAFVYLQKPVTKDALEKAFGTIKEYVERPMRKLLLVEDDEADRKSITDLIGNSDVRITAVATGREALEALKIERFDCAAAERVNHVVTLPEIANLLGRLAECSKG